MNYFDKGHVWLLFGHALGKIELLFILTSGHTGDD